MKKLLPLLILCAIPVAAIPQTVSGGALRVTPLYVTGTSVGNTADTNEDTLVTYTLPANTLANVGDRLHIVAGGTFAASTDTKTARVRFGGISGVAVSFPNGSTTGQTAWYVDCYITKTGANQQSYVSLGATPTNNSGLTPGAAAKTDTASIDILVTGRNSTTATANSITSQYFSVDLIRAP